MKKIPLSTMTLVSLVVSILVYETMSTSILQVQIPTELFRKDGYPHKEALFGIPKYGATISERLLYGGDYENLWTFCKDEEATAFFNTKANGSPFLLLVDRGECSFVSKVRRAQRFGAAGVIVANNLCVCGIECKEYNCEVKDPVMQDDGTGQDVDIPSFLMERADGNIIKSKLRLNGVVKVEMTWNLPTPDARVEWSLWTIPHDDQSLLFIDEFRNVISELGKHQYFEPFYQVRNGSQFACDMGVYKPIQCTGLCTNNGRYCMDVPANTTSYIEGKDLVRESLRQKCIWNEYGGHGTSDEGIGLKWWNYVSKFYETCLESKFTDENCISSAMKDASIDIASIDKCMKDSGGTEDDVVNTVLKQEVTSLDLAHAYIIPTLFVNNVVERGRLSTASVLSAICSGYATGTEPDTCKCSGLSSSDAVFSCIQNGNTPFVIDRTSTRSTGVSLGGVVIIIIVIIVTMTAAGVVYWKRTQAHMHDRVRGILSEYMLLDDDQDVDKGSMSFEFASRTSNGHEYAAPTPLPQRTSVV